MKSCSNCKYYNRSCGRYIMNPELLKDPKECGKLETNFPHWELHLTDEIKEKVFAQYLHHRWKFKSDVEGFEKAIKHRLSLSDINNILYNPQFKKCDIVLILKPLSLISEDDAFEIGKIIEIDRENYDLSNITAITAIGRQFAKAILIYDFSRYTPITINIYQFLLSKGYDLPQYLLGNKTLNESGLAIY